MIHLALTIAAALFLGTVGLVVLVNVLAWIALPFMWLAERVLRLFTAPAIDARLRAEALQFQALLRADSQRSQDFAASRRA
jgi:hypothetical protein